MKAAGKRPRARTSIKTQPHSALPNVKRLASIPNEKPRSGWFRIRRTSGARGETVLNSSMLFFGLLIVILLVFLAVAFLGAYYFSLRGNNKTSHSSLRNNSLLLTNQAARYRSNMNSNATLSNNVNRKSACTSISSQADCQERPDCTVEYTCACDTSKRKADKCGYDLSPNETCVCEQSDFNRCIELVCPIDR